MKYVGKFNAIVFLCIVLAFGLGISRVGDDVLSIGKKNSVLDKIIYLGSNRLIRSNETTGELEFSNNGGSSYLSVGEVDNTIISKPLSEVKNGNAEAGLINWTNTHDDVGSSPLAITVQNHAVVTQNYGESYFRIRTPDNATADMYFSQVVPLNAAYKNQECVVQYSHSNNFTYQNRFILEILNQSGVVIATGQVNGTESTRWQEGQVNFNCGDNNNITVRIKATCAEFCGDTGLFEDLFLDNVRLSVRETNPTKFYYKSWILPTSAPGAYQFLFDNSASFDQISSGVIGLQTDFVSSKIICANGTLGTLDDPFGVNSCTTNGTLGIAVTLPRAGRYEVCTKFNYFTNNVADEGIFTLSEAFLGQDNYEKVYLKAAATASSIHTTEVCGTFTYQPYLSGGFPLQAGWILFGRRVGASAGQGIEVYMNTTSDYDSYMYWTVREL